MEKAEDSLFYEPFALLANDTDFAQEIIETIQEEAKIVIMDEVLPAYRQLQAYIQEEYLPATRSQIGLLSATDGLDFYEKALRAQITVHGKRCLCPCHNSCL